jgi:hypothetical protein
VDAKDASPDDSPVVAGASFQLWNPHFGNPFGFGKTDSLEAFLETRLIRQRNSKATAFFGLSDEDLTPRPWQRFRIVFRDISRSSDPRTGIFSLVAPRHFTLEGSPYLFVKDGTEREIAYLLGTLSSIPFDWICRQWVDLHLKFYIIQSLPIPLMAAESELDKRIVEIVASILRHEKSFHGWVESLGAANNDRTKEEKLEVLVAELDAVVSIKYGLEKSEVVHIFENFHQGWDYQPRLAQVLEFFDQWKDK